MIDAMPDPNEDKPTIPAAPCPGCGGLEHGSLGQERTCILRELARVRGELAVWRENEAAFQAWLLLRAQVRGLKKIVLP